MLKENFSVIIIGNVFSLEYSVHPSAQPHRFSNAKPECDILYLARAVFPWPEKLDHESILSF
jgi:hypothetical protein